MRQICYVTVVVVLLSALPVMGQQSTELAQLADYGSDAQRDLSRVLFPMWMVVSLVIATVFLSRSIVLRIKRPAWITSILAIVIVFLGPLVCELIYSIFCYDNIHCPSATAAICHHVGINFTIVIFVVLGRLLFKSPTATNSKSDDKNRLSY